MPGLPAGRKGRGAGPGRAGRCGIWKSCIRIDGMKKGEGRTSKVRSFSATDEDVAMLEAVAEYHGFSRSATLVGLVRREFWRLFPAGTGDIRPARGARVKA